MFFFTFGFCFSIYFPCYYIFHPIFKFQLLAYFLPEFVVLSISFLSFLDAHTEEYLPLHSNTNTHPRYTDTNTTGTDTNTHSIIDSKTQGQTHTTHKTSITAIQTHTQDSQTQKPQELPQPHTQNTQETQHTFHSKKQPVHKFCVDTSKHLMRKPSLLIGKTPIPNTVIQFSEYVYPDCQKPHHTPCYH